MSSSNVVSLSKPVAPARSFAENRNDHSGPRAACVQGRAVQGKITNCDATSTDRAGRPPLMFGDPGNPCSTPSRLPLFPSCAEHTDIGNTMPGPCIGSVASPYHRSTNRLSPGKELRKPAHSRVSAGNAHFPLRREPLEKLARGAWKRPTPAHGTEAPAPASHPCRSFTRPCPTAGTS